MLAGNKRALAGLITLCENNSQELPAIMKAIATYTGKAFIIGITGPPGTGKSSITGKLTTLMREKGLKVGILAIDPTSPLSGGAFLGDRIRMTPLDMDENIFIRSMANRGSGHGLAKAIVPAIKLLDAFGKDIIVVETVGTGQTDTAVKNIVDILVLVLSPGFGDTIQLMKAGVIEVADIVAINKTDLMGADELLSDLRIVLAHDNNEQKKSVIGVQAESGIGIDELYTDIVKRRQNLVR